MLRKWLGALTVRAKVCALVAMPMIALLMISLPTFTELWHRSHEKTAQMGEISVAIRDLVDNMATERGTSAGFIGSGAGEFRARLEKVRSDTDQSLSRMEWIVGHLDTSNYGKVFENGFREAKVVLGNLQSIRNSVDRQSASVSEVVQYYTDVNSKLIDKISLALTTIDDHYISQRGTAYTFFLRAKDAMGLERAVGAVGFGGGWEQSVLVRFSALVNLRQDRIQNFLAFSEESDVAAYESVIKDPIFAETLRLQQAAVAGTGAGLISGEAWFDLMTKKLATMRNFDDSLLDRLNESTIEHDKKALADLWFMIGFESVIVLLVLALSFVVMHDLTKGLRALSGSVKKLTDNDFQDEVAGQTRGDEFGAIARALEVLRLGSAEKELADAELQRSRDAQQVLVNEIQTALDALRDGDLTFRLDTPFAEEYETLRENFNAASVSLGTAMDSVSTRAQSVITGAAEIRSAADDLSHRTESQAATLEETAAALEELTSSVQMASENAGEVENIVSQAQTEAEENGKVVKKTITAMSEIERSSTEISQIIGVIDDIAFQTNLLALNAGVEAARAGEAGKGFAVVASEVRGLAQRSSDAAKQIKNLINESTDHVARGVELVGNSSEALTSIIGRVAHISELMGEVATGAKEQATGLNEINVGVSQLDQVTQQNAAMVEEATAAGQLLHKDATDLTDAIAQFRFDGGGGQAGSSQVATTWAAE